MHVPLLNIEAQHHSIKPDIDAAVAEVGESEKYMLGPQVKACEEAVASYCGSAYGVGVSSGCDALRVSLQAAGIGPEDEVIAPAYSFFATAGCIAQLRIRPNFVDVDPVTCNIDPAKIEEKLTDRTRAILVVHLFGQMADMKPIMTIAKRRGLVVIEDVAQAIGAEYRGRRAGSIGHYGCLSFGGFGEGGMVVINDREQAARLQVFSTYRPDPKGRNKNAVGNSRLDSLQAAMVLAKLKHTDDWIASRQANARRYDALFEARGMVAPDRVRLPGIASNTTAPAKDGGLFEKVEREDSKGEGEKGNSEVRDPDLANSTFAFAPSRHAFSQYVIRVPRRNELAAYLKTNGIGTEVFYPLHLQECFANFDMSPGDFPESEKAANEALALPIYPELSDKQAAHVVDCIAEFFRKTKDGLGQPRTVLGPSSSA
jgi:dTDP-4-amino-4,6-dideoxygalactose transaminase